MNIKKISSLAVCIAVPLGLATSRAQAEDFLTAWGQVGDATNVTLNVSSYPNPPDETTGATTPGDFYVGLTQGSLSAIVNGNLVTSGLFYMYCVDFNGEIYPPTSYGVTVESLAGPTISPDNLGLSLADLQYQATLGAEFGTSPSGDSATDSAIQEDIWNISAPSTFSPTTTAMQQAITAANSAFASEDFSNAYLLDIGDPSQASSEQAFMPVDSPSSGGGLTNPETPEPATFGLMSLALAGFGGVFYRKTRRGAQS